MRLMSQLATSKLSVSSISVPAMPETSKGSKSSMSAPALRNASTFLWKLIQNALGGANHGWACGKARKKKQRFVEADQRRGIGEARGVEAIQQLSRRGRLRWGRSDSGRLRVG
jgi:hypothetical protein